MPQTTPRNDAPRHALPLVLVLALASLRASAVEAAILRVGPISDTACYTNNIAAALLVAALNGEDDEIWLSNQQVYNGVNISLVDFPDRLAIAGGFEDCSDNFSQDLTTLNGTTSNPVISVDTVSGTNYITLFHLNLDGPGTGYAIEGLRVSGDSLVFGLGLQVTDFGDSGISVTGTDAHLFLDEGTFIHHNYAFHGGGFRCGSGAGVVSHAWLEANEAEAGGGIFAGLCTVQLYYGAALLFNQAIDGGGIYVNGGGRITIDASAAPGVQVFSNVATDQGGGIYAQDVDTEVQIHNGSINGNHATNQGGAIYARAGAIVQMDRIPGFCSVAPTCVSLTNNALESGNQGAAVYAGEGALVQLYQANIRSNTIAVGAVFGSVLHANGLGTVLEVESAYLWGNERADTLFEGTGNAFVGAAFVTANSNDYTCGASSCPARPVVLSGGATASLFSSIFYPNSPVAADVGGAALVGADCLLLSNTSNLPAGTVVMTDDPQFLDTGTGNLHLPPGSPAVDACDAFYYLPTHADVDGDPRPIDVPTNLDGYPGVIGRYDLGADEVATIFSDGFESGNTSQWSSTVP